MKDLHHFTDQCPYIVLPPCKFSFNSVTDDFGYHTALRDHIKFRLTNQTVQRERNYDVFYICLHEQNYNCFNNKRISNVC